MFWTTEFKRARFFSESKFIFSCVRTDVKICVQSLWQRYEISSEIRDICQFLVLFWYILLVVLLTCSCRRLIFLLDYHFSLPCLHITCSIFSRIKFRQNLSFNGSTFAHFSYSLRFSCSVSSISLFETLFRQRNKQA